jgi:glycine/D-amino acid oxidase-like deaminating enzyme
MLNLSGTAQSFFVASVDGAPDFPPLAGALEVDVAIVGGGIVGLSAAELLRRAGRRVAVLEALKVGQQVTGRSTAKVTSQHGLIYQRLAKSFGEDGARAYGAANQAGLEQIARFIEELDIACDFARVPAFVYTRSESHVAQIEQEVEVARRLGLPAAFVRDTSLPFPSQARSASTTRRSSIRADICSGWRGRSRLGADVCSRAPEHCRSSTASRAGSPPSGARSQRAT